MIKKIPHEWYLFYRSRVSTVTNEDGAVTHYTRTTPKACFPWKTRAGTQPKVTNTTSWTGSLWKQREEIFLKKLLIAFLLVFTIAIMAGCAEQNKEIPNVQFTAATLAEYDGKDGRSAYIAVDGLVYDASNHKSWTDGEHHGFSAGKDLSEEFHKTHKETTLRKLPIMGTYIDG
jgi:predicted heme/steroid binding protein